MASKEQEFNKLKQLVELKQGEIHPDILKLTQYEQELIYKEALGEDLIVNEQEIEESSRDLEDRIKLVKLLASVIS